MLRLYDYAASGNCYKVRLLLAQLGLDYERVPIDIFGGDTLTHTFGRVNPARRTPVLEVSPNRFLPESNAILLYLAEGTQFLPEAGWERAQVYRWMFFEQNAFEPSVASARFWRLTGRDELEPSRYGSLVKSAHSSMAVLDTALTDAAFLAGATYTVADIALYAYAHVAHEADIDQDRFPHVQAWRDRITTMPGVIHDLEQYPDNALPGRGQGIHNQ
jgi:glutathione S-transferase